MQTKSRTDYYDRYWREQDLTRVSARARWRARKLYDRIGDRYRHLLDVGAGQGELLEFFRAHGYDTSGWDLSAEAVAKLRQAGFTAEVVDLETDELIGKHELITCCEVLQHTRDPLAVLLKLQGVLADGGRLLVTVPNEFHVMRRLGRGQPCPSHVTLFFPRAARQLAAKAGWVVEYLCHQPLTPPRWGRFAHALGTLLARLRPSLFSLSTMMLLRRRNDD